MTLSRQNELTLIKQAQQGNPVAREACVLAFDSLIQSKALKFLGHGMELEDLIQEGRLCIHRWLDRYLPEKVAPGTYFGQRLEWHFIHYKSVWLGLRDEARKGWPKVLAAVEALKGEGTKEPTLDAIARQSNVRQEIVAEILAAQRGREIAFPAEEEMIAHRSIDMPNATQLSAEEMMVQADGVMEQFQPLVEALQVTTAPFLALCILRESDVYGYTWQEIAMLLTDSQAGPPGWNETVQTDYPHLPVSLIEWMSVQHCFATPPPECTPEALRQWYSRQRRGLRSSDTARSGA